MTKSTGSLLFIFLFPLLLSFNSGGHLKFANGLVVENSWCIAKYSTHDSQLIANIEYACNVSSDCTLIQPGGSCFYPNTLLSQASAAMNQYYALEGRNTWNCYFSGSGIIVITDPSYGNCMYA